jgi:hypothetical protein
MAKEQAEPRAESRFDGGKEWAGQHERRKRSWSEQDRKWRKERRNRPEIELDETAEPAPSPRELP